MKKFDRAMLLALPVALLIASMMFMHYKHSVSAWVCLLAYAILVVNRLYVYCKR